MRDKRLSLHVCFFRLFNRFGWLYNIFLPLIVTENHCAHLLLNSLSQPHIGVPLSEPSGKHVRLTFSVEALWAAAWRMFNITGRPAVVHKTTVWWFLALFHGSIGLSGLNFLVICHIKTFLWNWKIYFRRRMTFCRIIILNEHKTSHYIMLEWKVLTVRHSTRNLFLIIMSMRAR